MNVAKIKATQAGTFTKKIQRQPSALVIQPPIIGPDVSAMPRQAPQIAKALARSSPVNVLEMMASAAVRSKAPPHP